MTETHTHSVIIVEDSRDTRDSRALLHGSTPAGSGPAPSSPDLVMTAMDGRAFLEDLQRSVHAAIPVMVFTGHQGCASWSITARRSPGSHRNPDFEGMTRCEPMSPHV
jgi:hypothetical protein